MADIWQMTYFREVHNYLIVIKISLKFAPIDSESLLVKVMVEQATNHYLDQCWPIFVAPYDVTGPQWVNHPFLHDRSRISQWIKSTSNELDITIHVIVSQLSGHCDVVRNRLWRHQQNENRASETRRCGKVVVLLSFMDDLCRVRNKIMYVLSWRTVSALTGVLFWY